ncbi:hypothetical protein DBV15_04034 [Temnothorax longispinosus]|uniref:Uncharacterized protein n=1 Tax=Temnothorax longispinosus TaxID=300112 RepID=A0A4S2KCV7_9HYME|nr:hypothetical protein DBV15_04034 [Temnothorax longispinosus]
MGEREKESQPIIPVSNLHASIYLYGQGLGALVQPCNIQRQIPSQTPGADPPFDHEHPQTQRHFLLAFCASRSNLITISPTRYVALNSAPLFHDITKKTISAIMHEFHNEQCSNGRSVLEARFREAMKTLKSDEEKDFKLTLEEENRGKRTREDRGEVQGDGLGSRCRCRTHGVLSGARRRKRANRRGARRRRFVLSLTPAAASFRLGAGP